MSDQPHPMQPIYRTPDDQPRFKMNKVVRHLLDQGPFSLTDVWQFVGALGYSDEDLEQFYQLIGYSVGGYGEMFPKSETTHKADKIADNLPE